MFLFLFVTFSGVLLLPPAPAKLRPMTVTLFSTGSSPDPDSKEESKAIALDACINVPSSPTLRLKARGHATTPGCSSTFPETFGLLAGIPVGSSYIIPSFLPSSSPPTNINVGLSQSMSSESGIDGICTIVSVTFVGVVGLSEILLTPI